MHTVSTLGITVSKSNASDYTQTESINKTPSKVLLPLQQTINHNIKQRTEYSSKQVISKWGASSLSPN